MFWLPKIEVANTVHKNKQKCRSYIETKLEQCVSHLIPLWWIVFVRHAEQTQFIIKELSDLHIAPILFQYMTYTSVCFCVLYLLLQFSAAKTLMIDVLLQSALLMLLFWTTNLIVSFGTYFIIWHSWPSLHVKKANYAKW